jgi:Zn-dependent peptidase ImmA (M78 family)/DNA-binding XRE family transcriptional regulator
VAIGGMTSQQAYISPLVLRWARKRARLSISETASKAVVNPKLLSSWEEENTASKPTIQQALKLANVLHVPFGYFFLSAPPQEKPLLPDLRTVSDEQRNSFSPDFLDLLSDTLIKQQWYHEFLKQQSADDLPFIGKYATGKYNENAIAEDISQTLGVTDVLRDESSGWESFLRSFIGRVEDSRILVLRSGVVRNNPNRKLSVDEFRGFAITDRLAPLIFINGKDAKAAQIFTLAHELAHLWIGKDGISNPNLSSRVLSNTPDVERLCNRIAAQVLVPKQTFMSEWSPARPIRENITRLTRRYRVSSLVILRRAFDLERIGWDSFIRTFNEEKERYASREDKDKQESAGGDFYATLGSRNSKQLIRAVVSAAFEGRESFGTAAHMLGVKVQTLGKVANEFDIH